MIRLLNFFSLVDDGVNSVITSSGRFDRKTDFLIFILVINLLVFSSYYETWFYHLKKIMSQQPLMLEQKKKQFGIAEAFLTTYWRSFFLISISFFSYST